MKTPVKPDIDWETWFENATEDVSSYAWALSELEDALYADDCGHWLTTGLCHRSRGIQALATINRTDLPTIFQPYRKKLQSLMEKADSDLNRLTYNHSAAISKLFLPKGDLWNQVVDLEVQLKSLRRTLQDRLLFHEETEPPDETLQDLAEDFLLAFAASYRTATDAPSCLVDLEGFVPWRHHFLQLDRQFQKWFGYLEPVADMLAQFRQQEYDADFWWLTQKPVMDDVREPEMDEAWLQNAAKTGWMSDKASCPEIGQVIAYAFHELTGVERLDIQQHVWSCHHCLNLVLDLRAAREEAGSDNLPAVDWNTFLSASRQPDIQSDPMWRQIPAPAMLGELTARFGDIVNWPQSIPASLQNSLELLFLSPFKPEALPLMASDHSGDVVIAKLIQLEENGDIQSILPVTVIIHHLIETDDEIEISGELPLGFETASEIEFHFAWQNRNGSLHVLKTGRLECRGIHFAANLEKPDSGQQDGGIRIVFIRKKPV